MTKSRNGRPEDRGRRSGGWRPFRRLRLALLLLTTLAAAFGVGFLVFAMTLPSAVSDPRTLTDAIVVLTGGSDRVETGFELLERGLARRLFISGVAREVQFSALLAAADRPEGHNGCCVVLGRDASDTLGNARETASWVRREHLRSLRLVTAQYHMPRSLLVFRRAMPEVTIIPHPVFPDRVRSDDWWLWPGTTRLLAQEYLKYLAALAYGWTGGLLEPDRS